MMRSMFSGVSGLKNHQVRMDVIGNNIANINTVGFKGSRTTFQETLNQTLSSASAPHGNRGGVNAQQVGLGVALGSIDVIHSPGGTQGTSSETDLAIEGTGFFILGEGDQQYFTRAGMFEFDGAGNLSAKNGLPVMGYLADDQGRIVDSGRLEQLTITDDMRTTKPQPTSEVVLNGNITSFTEVGDKVSRMATVYDSLGGTHRVVVDFEKSGNNEWNWTARLETDDPDDAASIRGLGEITFNNDGTIANVDESQVTLPSDALIPAEAGELTFNLDFSGIRQWSEDTSLVVQSNNGFPSGNLDQVSIDQSGKLIGSYSNGSIQELGQIALARFENPPGLVKAGDTMFAASVNSGNAVIGSANSGGFGTVNSNSLEMSNVDLSEEFTEMIITQRGFQANSRIITSADELLQELVNLKR